MSIEAPAFFDYISSFFINSRNFDDRDAAGAVDEDESLVCRFKGIQGMTFGIVFEVQRDPGSPYTGFLGIVVKLGGKFGADPDAGQILIFIRGIGYQETFQLVPGRIPGAFVIRQDHRTVGAGPVVAGLNTSINAEPFFGNGYLSGLTCLF